MTWDAASPTRGVNLRQTSTYVTDGANETYSLGVAYASESTRNDVKCGWSTDNQANARDRDSGNDARLAGLGFMNGAANTFRIDLPTAGVYDIRLALGDPAAGWTNMFFEVFDNASSLFTLSAVATSAAQRFLDATGTEYTNATWAGSNTAVRKTFSSTIFNIQVGKTAFGLSVLAHVELTLIPATGSVGSGLTTGITLERRRLVA